MSVPRKGREVEIEESERLPNLYTTRALFLVLAALFVSCVFNEVGIFEVNRVLIWACFFTSALSCVIAYYLAHSEKYAVHPRSKYVIISIVIFLTLNVTMFLSSHVTLLLILPMLLATQYRSMKISCLAVAGSCVCCLLSPVLSWFAGAWGLNYMTGYLETVCRVSIQSLGPAALPASESIRNILLYVGVPQLMIVSVFAFVFLSITRISIRGLKNHIQVMDLSDDLNMELAHVVTLQNRMLYSVADLIESRDIATGGHVKRTSEIVRMLVREMQKDPARCLSPVFCDIVIKAAPLHDIGKIAIDDAILRKPRRLTRDERAIIQQHPIKSGEIIRNIFTGIEDEEFIRLSVNLARHHHEHYDGTGYPDHLQGERIPLEARIMAIADVYDALVSERSYKKPLSHDQAREIILQDMGSQFDPALEPYFTAVWPQIRDFYAR